MASFILSIIPADQAYVPDIHAQHRAVALLRRACPEGRECEARTYDELTWVHPHFNLVAILCPSCGTRNEIDRMREDDFIDPIRDWWERVEQEASVSPVEKVTVIMPCCSRIVPLPTLEFDWPGGFAHFELSIWDIGGDDGLLPPGVLAELEKILGCELLQIRSFFS